MSDYDRLKIAYLCDISPLEKNLYSGGNARIHDALQRHVGDVTILDNSWHLVEPVRRLMHRLPEALNLRMRWRMHLLLSRIIARGVRKELADGQYDVLFGAYSFQSMMGLTPPYPMVTAFTADATPTTYKRSEVGQSFGSFLSVSRYLDPLVLQAEKKIFKDIDLLLWPTGWLKSGADALYELDEEQSVVIPWGANIDRPSAETAPVELNGDAPVQLLFVGRDWFAKGGPIAFEVLKALTERGVDARLTVIGCVPPEMHTNDKMHVIAQIDKAVPEQMEEFEKQMRGAHFLIQPSFESFGFAFCEASAYHLPALCLRVGGVPVRDGINGHALELGSDAVHFAEVIQSYLGQPDRYAQLRMTSRAEYENYLNWDAWGMSVGQKLRKNVNKLRR